MAFQTRRETINRCKSGYTSSPIIVYKTSNPDMFITSFASTVISQQDIKNKKSNIVGICDSTNYKTLEDVI